MSFCLLLFSFPSFCFSDSLPARLQRQRLIRARGGPEEGAASGEEGANGPWGRENGTVAEGDGQPLEGGERGKETGGEAGGGVQPKEEEEEEEEQEDGEEENAPFKPFVLPSE